MCEYTYRIVYSFVCFGWNVLDKHGVVVYETTTKADAEEWIRNH